MSFWMTLLNFSLDAGALMIMLIGLFASIFSRSIEAETRSFFMTFFSVLTLYAAANLASQIAELYGNSPRMTQMTIFIESFSSSLLLLMLTRYLHICAKKDIEGSFLHRIVLVLWLIYIGLLIYTQFSQSIYYISSANEYHRGPLYPILLVPPILVIMADMIALIVWRKRFSRQQIFAFLVYMFLPLITMVIQMLYYGLFLIVFSTTFSAGFLFVTMMQDQSARYIAQSEELALQRASIAVLQMRPHFICNTLMSIYYLCGQDAERAQRVILDFTTYLRKNFTAIAREETISFTEELEHTRAYLSVEQMRFEEDLFVEFDTPHTLFRLPPLTLQPIVENAVKHGMDPEAEPLHITIRTRDTAAGSEITVLDNGPGYEAADKDTPHVALKNIRQRLELMCRGSMRIESLKSGGTAVTVTIP